MVFVGDIALPSKGAINYLSVPEDFFKKRFFGNLEGALVDNDNYSLRAVYNQKSAIDELMNKFHFDGFALANNHIFDTGSIEETVSFLESRKLRYCGIGTNLEEANKEVVIQENEEQIVIVNFGWEVIQCEITLGNNVGVNPLRKAHVLATIEKLRFKYPKGRIIPFMHWSYELEAEPQPFERELAKKLIDHGADGVIGCHPHRIGGFELYQGKPVVYSLGNWLFKQHHYFNKKLMFPSFCNLELAFEWSFTDNKFLFHFFEYDPNRSSLTYIRTEEGNSETMKNHTPFADLTSNEYSRWYKKHHFHRAKGLPVFYWEDTKFSVLLKNSIIKLRDKAIKKLLNKGK